MKLKTNLKAGRLKVKNKKQACEIYEKWYGIKKYPDIKRWAAEEGCKWAE